MIAIRSIAVVALLAFGASSCHVTAAKIHNLDELHDENGHHRVTAALEGDAEYLMRNGMRNAFLNFGGKFNDKEPTKVDDPTESCIENMVALADCDSSDPTTAAAQVEEFAKLTTDVWKLSRERAVIELGHAGHRLELASHPIVESKDPVASIDDVRGALTKLIASVTPLFAKATPDRAKAEKDFNDAIDGARKLNVDVIGGSRLLRGVRLLAERAGDYRSVLQSLSIDLQRRLTALALRQAADDKTPIVRAAAVPAGREAFGDAWLFEWLAKKRAKDSEPDDVMVALCDDLAERGLPAAHDDEQTKARDSLTNIVYSLATRHPEGRVRVRAMLALAVISNHASTSLREEDWQTWWLATHPETSTDAPPAAKPAAESKTSP